jgi:dTDP-4-dehydrorhamnose 3,5-epimerase
MIVTATEALPDVLIIEPRVFRDDRGFFVETYHALRYRAAGIDVEFVQDNHSRSVRGTLRGLHWQTAPHPQAKLVRVLEGEILDVAVDIRPGSPTFGRSASVTLSADNFRQLFIPVGFAHGFLVLSERADIEYKCSDVYDPAAERGLMWNDPELAIAWPTTSPTLSARDQGHPPFSTLRAGHTAQPAERSTPQL